MKSIFLTAILLLATTQAEAKSIDCTKLQIKDFKIGDKCVDGPFKKGGRGALINPACVATVNVENSDESIYYGKPSIHSNYLGFSDSCDNSQGKSLKDLPEDCRLYFSFEAKRKYDYRSCTCNKHGCGQLLIQKLTEQEVKDLKENVGTLGDGREGLLKRCNGNVTLLHPEADKTTLFVSSTDCILRRGDTALFDLKDDYERFCVEGATTPQELEKIKANYRTTTWRTSYDGRIYAVVCQPKVLTNPLLVEKKKGPLSDYWPRYEVENIEKKTDK